MSERRSGHSYLIVKDGQIVYPADPVVTVTEADARVAAMRQRCVEIIRAYCRAEQQTVVAIEAIEKLPASDAALRVIVARARRDEAAWWDRQYAPVVGGSRRLAEADAELAAAEADMVKGR